MTHSKKKLLSSRLIRSSRNLARRKSINFDNTQKLPEASWKLFWKLSPKRKKTHTMDMTAALEAPGSFLEAVRKFMNENLKTSL